MKSPLLMVGPMMPRVMDALAGSYEVHRLWEAPDREAFLRETGGSIRAVATTGTLGAGGPLLDALPKLEIIACYGVGVDAIDLPRAKARGIAVTTTPDVLTADVADLAVGLLIATCRRMVVADRYVRAGEWVKRGEMPLARQVSGKKVGIVGLGRIGKAVARRLAAMDCEVSYQGRRAQPEVPYAFVPDLLELARRSDFLVLTAAGGPQTRGIINAGVLDALGPEGVLVNVARGSLVDEEALVRALQEGRLAGAGLDVFAQEPKVPEALLTMDQVVLQPHQGSGTRETRAAMGDLVIGNLAAHFAGQSLLTPYPV